MQNSEEVVVSTCNRSEIYFTGEQGSVDEVENILSTFHQVKDAYLLANNHGYTNSELNIIFQGAFHCAKLSKTTTKLSTTPVSIGTLTANAVEQYQKEQPETSKRLQRISFVPGNRRILRRQ